MKNVRKLVLIACSTGGPNALGALIPQLEAHLDAPVVVVQHIPKGFTPSLTKRLNSLGKIRVSEAFHEHPLQKGNVYIARGGTHLKISQNLDGSLFFIDDDSEPVNGLKPYANITFSSVKDLDLDFVCCVVLTGMGSDGYAGLCDLKQTQNVYAIAQDKDSCVVYGMPKVIVEHNLSDTILPLELIGNEINKKVGVY